MVKIAFEKPFEKRFGRIKDNSQKEQLKKLISKIIQNPEIGKRLTHELKGLLSYRSGDYRIIYRIHHKEITVLILTIGDRKNIYKQISKKLH